VKTNVKLIPTNGKFITSKYKRQFNGKYSSWVLNCFLLKKTVILLSRSVFRDIMPCISAKQVKQECIENNFQYSMHEDETWANRPQT
jgi:hypothetical protein